MRMAIAIGAPPLPPPLSSLLGLWPAGAMGMLQAEAVASRAGLAQVKEAQAVARAAAEALAAKEAELERMGQVGGGGRWDESAAQCTAAGTEGQALRGASDIQASLLGARQAGTSS